MKKKILIMGIAISIVVTGFFIALIYVFLGNNNSNDEHTHSYESTIVAPTCTEQGYTKHTCSCGDEYIDSYTERVDHSIVGKFIKEPTCSEEGYEQGTCSICNKVFKKYLSTIPHQMGEIVYGIETCNGSKVGEIHCKDCNELISTVGHKYEIEYIYPTCTKPGKQISTCIYCNDVKELEISPLGHEKGEEKITLSTCTKKGKIESFCVNCNTLLYSTTLDLNNHEYSSVVNENKIVYTCVECNHSYTEEIETESFKVSFVTNNDKVLEDIYVKEGQVLKPVELEKKGYEFVGWYLDENFEIPYTEDPIWEDTILYACFGLSYLETEYEEKTIESNVDKNFTFEVESNINLTNDNVNNYVKVTSSLNEQVSIKVSEKNGLYIISSNDYQEGEIYNVEVKEGVTLYNRADNQLTFMIKPENKINVDYKDNVKVISTSQVNSIVNEAEKDIIILKEKLFDEKDIFVIVDNNMPQGMYQVETYAYDNVNYIYTCIAPNSEEVFNELEISGSGEAQIEQLALDEQYLSSMIEAYKKSNMSKVLNKAIEEFSKTEAMMGYTFDDIEFEPVGELVSNNSVKLGLKIIAKWKGNDGSYRKIVVKFIDTIALNVSHNIGLTNYRFNVDLHNTFNFGLALVVGNEYDSVQSTDDVSLLEFRKIYKNLSKGNFEELLKEEKAADERKKLASLYLNVCGVPVEIAAFSGVEWDMYGQIGIDGTITYTQNTMVWGNLFDINTKTSKSTNSYLMLNVAGKIYVNPYIEVEIIVGLDNIFGIYLSGQVGPYEELGGMASVVFGTDQKPLISSGIYLEYGINVELNLGLEVLGAQFNVELINKDIELYSMGTKEIPLYFENSSLDETIVLNYNETIDLNEQLNNMVFIYNIEDLSTQTKEVDCEYSIYEIEYGFRKYIKLEDNTISIKPNEKTDLTIKFKVVYGTLIDYQTITFKINHTHAYKEIERKDPGCESQGYIKHGCDCGYQYLELIDPTGHDFVDNVCISCGYEQLVYSKGLVFRKLDGGYEVIEYIGQEEEIIIPEIYNGEYVIGIAEEAKIGSDNIINIILPSSLQYIGYNGLMLEDNITYNILENIKYLGNESNPYLVLIGVTDKNLTEYNIHYDTKIINFNAFKECEHLNYIEIPNNVIGIGDQAFKDCRSLQYNIYDNAKYLGNKENPYLVLIEAINKEITDCIINNSTKFVHSHAFRRCEKLTNISIPDSVISIGFNAFQTCRSLKSIGISNNIRKIGFATFQNCENLTNLILPNGLTSIGKYAFDSCIKLESIVVPNSVISIDLDAFTDCPNLQYNIYDNAKYLGNESNPYLVLVQAISKDIASCEINDNTKIIYSLNHCYKLKSITIPNGAISIGECAFSDCLNLLSVKIPNSVTNIGNDAFAGCINLISIEIPKSVTIIGEGVFAGCTDLISIEIPNGIISIGGSAFERCSSLKNIKIPNSVISIDLDAFYNCRNLKNVTFEKNSKLTRIGSNVFTGCSSLLSIKIPGSVTNIEEYVFVGCERLTIYCEANSKPDGWYYEWNYSNRPVVWGYTGE